MDEVVSVLTGVWRFVKFSTGRYVGLHPACQALVAAELTGLSSLVHYCSKDMKVGDHHIKGWAQLTVTDKPFAIIAALGSDPAATLLNKLLTDGRVNLKLEELEQAGIAAVRRTELISSVVYDHMATIADKDPI